MGRTQNGGPRNDRAAEIADMPAIPPLGPSSLIPGFALELESASVKPCSNLSAAVESNGQWM